MELKVFPITLKLYAHDEQEVEVLRFVFTEFVKHHAEQGRAVSAEKLTKALQNWEKNPLVRNRIISYFDGKQ